MAFSGLDDPRLKRIAVGVALALLLAGSVHHGRQLLSLRPLQGGGVVDWKDEKGLSATLHMTDGSTLRVAGLASRIDPGDTVQKQAGTFAYVVNGRSRSPVPMLVGAVILFWLFVPALALVPVYIYAGVQQE